jgi:hypothetical protein
MRDVTANRTLRNSLRPATVEHEQAADLLSAAADAFLDGSTEMASQHLRSANLPVLFRFGRLLMDRRDPEVAWPPRLRSVPKPDVARAKARMPTAAEILALYIRDGWRCRYCGCRVIYGRARDILRKAYPDEIPWPASGPSHGGFFALTATPDHVVPYAGGGDNSPGNLVTACWPCNFGMEHDSLGELGLSDPRLRPPVVDRWDGLTRLIARKPSAVSASPELRPAQTAHKSTRAKSKLTPEMHSTQSYWFSKLDARQRPQAETFVELLDSCRDLGVTWSAKEVLVARMTVGDQKVQFFGVEPDLAVQVPWSTNTPKEHLHRFAAALAEGIPGATLHETPKLWNVHVPPDRTVSLRLLLENKQIVRVALKALHCVLKAGSGASTSA